MASNNINNQIQECDKKLDSLYTHFGAFIFENMQKEKLFYCFEPECADLDQESTDLLKKLKYSEAQPQAAPQEQPEEQNEETRPKKSTINKRGMLEPYTELNIALFEQAEKLNNIASDIDQVLELTTVSLEQHDLQEIQNKHDNLMEAKDQITRKINSMTEVIKNIMGNKKQQLENGEITSTEMPKFEKDFLVKSAKEIKDLSKTVDTIVSHSKNFLKDIRKSYDGVLKKQQALQEQKLAKDTGVQERLTEEQTQNANLREELRLREYELKQKEETISELKEKEPNSITTDTHLFAQAPEEEAPPIPQEVEEEAEKHLFSFQPEDSSAEEASQLEEEIMIEDEVETDEEEQAFDSEEEIDYGIIETASRKLKDKETTTEKKLEILDILLNTSPNILPDFICELLKDEELEIRKQIISLLTQVDDEVVIDIYKKFLKSHDSYLRISGIMGLSRWDSAEARKTILKFVNDSDYAIRRLVANCINHNTDDEIELACLARLTNDPDEGVARIALRKLGSCKNRYAFFNVLPKLESEDIKIRREAIRALQNMTGTTLGYRFIGPENGRKIAIKKWKDLWTKNQSNPHFFRKIASGELKAENIVLEKENVASKKPQKTSKPKKKLAVKKKKTAVKRK